MRHLFHGPFLDINMNNGKTLFEQLKTYEHSDIYPFHMPGHKRRLAPEEAEDIYGMDITEIEGFDNLHEADGILKDAQQYAAQLYHSEETAFIINGSTAGILAAIAGTCEDGGSILVARNCHKSVYHAIELHHLEPVYIYPHVNTRYGINEGIYPPDVDKLWITHQNIQAIVITSPTYDGVVSDIREICRIAHEKKVPVIVDEAHGAHFNYSDYFPKSAVACGADIVIQSTHKTLPAMTQTALIHLNGSLVDRERVRRMLTIYQTSSPSYILMGSIDACLHMLGKNGDVLFRRYTDRLQKLRENIHQLRNIQMPELMDFNREYVKDYDRSKIVLSVGNTSISGQKLYEWLLKRYGIQMEMVSADYVLGMTSVGDTSDGYERLEWALKEIDRTLDCEIPVSENNRLFTIPSVLPVVEHVMSIYDAEHQKKTLCCLKKSYGHIAADYIYLYPPGIPLVTPGEVITEEVVMNLDRWLEGNLHVSGIYREDGNYLIRVIDR